MTRRTFSTYQLLSCPRLQTWVRACLTLPSFIAVGKDHNKLLFKDAAFLLTLAIADNALFGYESLDDVRKQKIPAAEYQLADRWIVSQHGP